MSTESEVSRGMFRITSPVGAQILGKPVRLHKESTAKMLADILKDYCCLSKFDAELEISSAVPALGLACGRTSVSYLPAGCAVPASMEQHLSCVLVVMGTVVATTCFGLRYHRHNMMS